MVISFAAQASVLLHTVAWPCKSPPLHSSDSWPAEDHRGRLLAYWAAMAEGAHQLCQQVETACKSAGPVRSITSRLCEWLPPNTTCLHSPLLATTGRQTAASSGAVRTLLAASAQRPEGQPCRRSVLGPLRRQTHRGSAVARGMPAVRRGGQGGADDVQQAGCALSMCM